MKAPEPTPRDAAASGLESHETEPRRPTASSLWRSRAAEEADGSTSSRRTAAGGDLLPILRGAVDR